MTTCFRICLGSGFLVGFVYITLCHRTVLRETNFPRSNCDNLFVEYACLILIWECYPRNCSLHDWKTTQQLKLCNQNKINISPFVLFRNSAQCTSPQLRNNYISFFMLTVLHKPCFLSAYSIEYCPYPQRTGQILLICGFVITMATMVLLGNHRNDFYQEWRNV